AQDHLEALELGMAEIEAFAGLVVGAGVRTAKLLRSGPGLERRLVDPGRVRRIQRVILIDGALEQMKLDEARHVAEVGFPAAPDVLECRLRADLHLEPVHCDKHLKSPSWGAPGVPIELDRATNAPKPRWSISTARSVGGDGLARDRGFFVSGSSEMIFQATLEYDSRTGTGPF